MFQKFKILERRGEDSGPFAPDEIIQVNESYSSNLKRVTMPTPVIEEVYKKGKALAKLFLNFRGYRGGPGRQINCN